MCVVCDTHTQNSMMGLKVQSITVKEYEHKRQNQNVSQLERCHHLSKQEFDKTAGVNKRELFGSVLSKPESHYKLCFQCHMSKEEE